MVGHHPISVKDQSRLHEFGETVLPGMFLAYALCGEKSGKGDVMVAVREELDRNPCSKTQCQRGPHAEKW